VAGACAVDGLVMATEEAYDGRAPVEQLLLGGSELTWGESIEGVLKRVGHAFPGADDSGSRGTVKPAGTSLRDTQGSGCSGGSSTAAGDDTRLWNGVWFMPNASGCACHDVPGTVCDHCTIWQQY
jgi:hypothetical protein